MTEILTVSDRTRANAIRVRYQLGRSGSSEIRIALRVVAGDPKPAIAKVGRYWVSWNGHGWVRPFRTWKGALRSLRSQP